MKQFIKVFLFSLIIFSAVITTGLFTYSKFMTPDGIAGEFPDEEDPLQETRKMRIVYPPLKGQCVTPIG